MVNPWILRDVEKAEKCDVDSMLRAFLSDCMVRKNPTKEEETTVYDKCLDSILPICSSVEIVGCLER